MSNFYGNFRDVDDLCEAYNIKKTNVLTETRKGDGSASGDPKKSVFTKDRLEFEYADLKKKDNIFKHIIVFTNDDDPKSNKTLRNIYDAIEALKKAGCETIPDIHAFVAADIDVSEDESEITLTDGDNKYTIKEQDNTDTLIFSRLGVQDEYDCEHAVKLLQDRGFLVLNPVQYSAVACDKYQTAVLLQRAGIPQPNFCLMTKEVLYDEKLFVKAMKDIYKDWDPKNPDNNEKFDLVVKILDGHGGTGVFLINGKRMYAVLQAMFAVKEDLSLIIQKKEEADGGDIRVHVLTLRDRQVILAAMKRVKIGGDFRSNVSLGASAEPVKLTEEQEQIALRAAKVSKLPWCAVDIMPIVKGSNPDLGDNAVLELNASPGTDGISEVIKENFINIMLSQLTDPKEFMLQDKTAGYIESISIDWGNGEKEYLAKLDTGSGAMASHIEVGEYEINGKKITFKVDGKPYTFDIIGTSRARTGDDSKENERNIILIPSLRLGLRRIRNIKMAVVRSRNKSTNALLNRETLSQLGYVISSSSTHMLTKEMEKIKIV